MKPILLCLAMALTACKSAPIESPIQPQGFILGPVVEPPMGCVELRRINPKADC